MLDSALAEQLRTHLANVSMPVELIASLGDDSKADELRELLEEITGMSEQLTLRTDGDDDRRPSFAITRAGTDVRVDFAGVPLGHEFTSLVLAMLHVGGHPPEGLRRRRRHDPQPRRRAPLRDDLLAVVPELPRGRPGVEHDERAQPEHHACGHRRRGVPGRGRRARGHGRARCLPRRRAVRAGSDDAREILARLDSGSAQRAAEEIDDKDPFDMLVVGGGPAGTSAAIYASRKGIRTGLVAERFGGQVADTMGIENLISVPYTEGPKLVSALEAHVNEYEVDVMNMQRAAKLLPASQEGGLIEVALESGASLRARSVVVSTGARWRHLGVPGEEEYKNKGVHFCPHCDGPFYKGKRIAVIGGGNSGVEAAIDLAGIVGHVTVIEFTDGLIADDVLQRKLHSLPNVDVVLSAQTTEITGDGKVVDGLVYIDRVSGDERRLDVDGVFVQIGLLPNTEWLEGSVELSDRNEVVIDDRGRTSVPGVFAAGDCTTVPYKQIVVSLGAGSTAALSAFDHLMRTSAPAEDQVAAAS